MKYTKGFPRGNIGASGWNIDEDVAAGQGIFAMPPDRVSTVTVDVTIPEGKGHARFTIERTYNSPARVGQDGTGGFWKPAVDDKLEFNDDTTVTIIGTVSGVRVACLEADRVINVCFAG